MGGITSTSPGTRSSLATPSISVDGRVWYGEHLCGQQKIGDIIGTDLYRASKASGIIRTSMQLHAS